MNVFLLELELRDKGDITGGNVPASALLIYVPYCRPDDLTNNWSSGDEAEPLLANVTGLENCISGFRINYLLMYYVYKKRMRTLLACRCV